MGYCLPKNDERIEESTGPLPALLDSGTAGDWMGMILRTSYTGLNSTYSKFFTAEAYSSGLSSVNLSKLYPINRPIKVGLGGQELQPYQGHLDQPALRQLEQPKVANQYPRDWSALQHGAHHEAEEDG